jgi:hypothetical protein
MGVEALPINDGIWEAIMKNGANEVMYRLAELLLEKMQKNGLITQEESIKIKELNIETFSPKLAKVYGQ